MSGSPTHPPTAANMNSPIPSFFRFTPRKITRQPMSPEHSSVGSNGMKDSEILVKVDTQRLPPRALFHREPVPGSPEDLMARYRGRLPLSVLTDLWYSQHNYSSDGLGGEGTPPSSTADYTPSHSSSGQGITDGEGTPSGDDSSNHATPTSSSPDSYWDENVQPFPVNSGSMHQVVQKSDSTALMTRPREMWVPNIIVDDNSYSVSATTVEKPKSGGQDNRSSLEEQSAIDANLLRRPAFQWSRICPPYQIFNDARSAFLHYLKRITPKHTLYLVLGTGSITIWLQNPTLVDIIRISIQLVGVFVIVAAATEFIQNKWQVIRRYLSISYLIVMSLDYLLGILEIGVVLAVTLALSPIVWVVTFVLLFSLTIIYNDQFVMLVYWAIGAGLMTGVVKTVRFYERGYWAARMEQRMVEYRQAGGRLE